MSIFSSFATIVFKQQLGKKLYRLHAAGYEPFDGMDPRSLTTPELDSYVRRAGEELSVLLQCRAQIEQPANRAKFDAKPWACKVAAEMIAIQALLPNRSYSGEVSVWLVQNETYQMINMVAALISMKPN